MGSDFIFERIEDYWDRKRVDYAILLASPWGWGKTYYIGEYVEERFYSKFPCKCIIGHGKKRGRFCYLSIGDYGELDAVKERLAIEVHGSAAKFGKKVGHAGKLVADIVGKRNVSVPVNAFNALLDIWLKKRLGKNKGEVLLSPLPKRVLNRGQRVS